MPQSPWAASGSTRGAGEQGICSGRMIAGMDMVIDTYERAVAAIPISARRISAGIVDGVVPLVLLYQVPVPLSLLPELEQPWDILPRVWLLLPLVGYFALYSLLSHWRWGRPLGKQILRLSVVRADGSQCSSWRLSWRELGRGASLVFVALPLLPPRESSPDLGISGGLIVLGIWAVCFAAAVWIVCPVIFWKRGLHDHIAATVVIGDAPRMEVQPPAHLQQDTLGLMIVLILAPVLVVAAALTPNVLTFMGVFLAGYLAVDTYDRYKNGYRPPGRRMD